MSFNTVPNSAVQLAASIKRGRREAKALRDAELEAQAEHGKTCPKRPHDSAGMLHGADDDRPYDVDGVAYCGRCHVALP